VVLSGIFGPPTSWFSVPFSTSGHLLKAFARLLSRSCQQHIAVTPERACRGKCCSEAPTPQDAPVLSYRADLDWTPSAALARRSERVGSMSRNTRRYAWLEAHIARDSPTNGRGFELWCATTMTSKTTLSESTCI
jgi:hypothetical protein